MGGFEAPPRQVRPVEQVDARTQIGFTTERTPEGRVHVDRASAEAAADRVERMNGTRPEVVETSRGFELVSRAEHIEPIRSNTGEAMTFKNTRQAEKYIAEVINDHEAKIDIVPVGKAGERRFALVEGASDDQLATMRKHPELTRFASTEDRSAAASLRMDEQIRARQTLEAREQFNRDLDQYIRDQMNPPRFAYASDEKAFVAIENRLAKERHVDLVEERPGGQTRRDAVQDEIDELSREVENRHRLGEVDDEDIATIRDADKDIEAATRAANVFEYAASCVAGMRI
jgi:hypothetical protein